MKIKSKKRKKMTNEEESIEESESMAQLASKLALPK